MFQYFLVLGGLTIQVTDTARLSKLSPGELLVLARSADQAFCAARMYRKGRLGTHRLPLGGHWFSVIVADELEQRLVGLREEAGRPSRASKRKATAHTVLEDFTSLSPSEQEQVALELNAVLRRKQSSVTDFACLGKELFLGLGLHEGARMQVERQ